MIVIILTEILYIVNNNYKVKLEYINLKFEWALRSNNLNIIQLQQKQCNELTHSRGLPPFKFSTDQVICKVWSGTEPGFIPEGGQSLKPKKKKNFMKIKTNIYFIFNKILHTK